MCVGMSTERLGGFALQYQSVPVNTTDLKFSNLANFSNKGA